MFAAFSFVIMMFNLPLPGGTTGHAVGVGIAAVVLGPWAAMVAVSIALLIQAVFFGDGGLTTLGANCLNMAIVGSGVAYGVYYLVAGQSALTARRRVIAAALAGYVAINVSALLTAVELGVQPLWFHSDDGVPLYAPYPLSIAIPAMMIGHLSVAGLAEAVVCGGLVAYLQKSNIDILKLTTSTPTDHQSPHQSGWLISRKLWAILGFLMVLSPIGLVASGVAWSEWGAADFGNPEMRQQIAHASGNQLLPVEVPAGLKSLAGVWSAPLVGYKVAVLPEYVAYVLSAVLGGGVVILASLFIGWFLRKLRTRSPTV
jgi:cobalt/nickel transport system permease protein